MELTRKFKKKSAKIKAKYVRTYYDRGVSHDAGAA